MFITLPGEYEGEVSFILCADWMLTPMAGLWCSMHPLVHVLALDGFIMFSELFSVILVAHTEVLGITWNMLKLETIMLG